MLYLKKKFAKYADLNVELVMKIRAYVHPAIKEVSFRYFLETTASIPVIMEIILIKMEPAVLAAQIAFTVLILTNGLALLAIMEAT